MPTIYAVSATIASAAVLALALPNEFAHYGLPLLGFVCLAPYFAVLRKTKSYRGAAGLGFIFGSLSHALSSYWLFFFQDFAFWTLGSTSIAYGFLHMLVAVFVRRFSLSPTAFRPFLVAAVWTVWEWAKSVGFLGYPWGLVAYALNEVSLLTQIADSTGVYGLSFFLALANVLAVEASDALRRSAALLDRRLFGGGLAVFAAIGCWFAVYGAFRLASPTPVVDRVPVVLVQHNADTWAHGGEILALRKCQDLSRKGLDELRGEGKRPALVVWSETVLRRPYEDYRPFFRKNPSKDPFVPFLEEIGVPLLTGAPIVLDWEKYDATNSAILLDPQGNQLDSYAKSHAVPFAEAIPFWEYQWMRDFMTNVVGLSGGWVMGTERNVMEVQTGSGRPLRFGVPICFEDAFAGVCTEFFDNGADILVNLTNDSWSKTVSAETQHFAVARFRAIENRRVLVRSTNAGVTAVVDAEGRAIDSLPLFAEGVLAIDVPVQKSAARTTYALLGDWLPVLLAALLFAMLIIEARRRAAQDVRDTAASAAWDADWAENGDLGE